MTERIVDISDAPARLCVRGGLLVLARADEAEFTLPLPEVAVLLIAHPQVALTHAVLAGIAGAGGVVVVCDEKRLPVGMLLPLVGHFLQAERLARQARASLPTRKQLWRQMVRAKVQAQAAVLRQLRGHDAGLSALAARVRSGDSENIEAQAARRYWPALFDDPDFRRGDEAKAVNPLLNYGYGVLRAMTARALCAAGLHPSLGVHHHNRYDPFCLADDLMEPFRPLVDRAVAQWADAQRAAGLPLALDRETKAAILAALLGRLELDGESRTLFDLLARAAASLAAALAGEKTELSLPRV